LSRVAEPTAVAAAFLDTLGVSPRHGVSDCDRLVEALEPRSLLLVVDNCEQVLDATAEVVRRVVGEATDVRVLAMSRERTRSDGRALFSSSRRQLPGLRTR
jgi:predicted ATPase